MSITPQEIDGIVRSVLKTLSGAGDEKTSSVSRETLSLDEPVISLGSIEGRLDGVRLVSVSAKAVVTPAVRDELRRRGIAWVRRERATSSREKENKADAAAARTLFVAVQGDVAAGGEAVIAAGVAGRAKIQRMRTDCVIEAVDALVENLRGGETLGLLVTEYIDAALCVANREPSLRAVAGDGFERLSHAVRSVGANVVIIGPKQLTAPIRPLLAWWIDRGVRPCPRSLRPRLCSPEATK